MEFVAKAKFMKIAPDKIRVLSSMIKNQKADWALSQLEFSDVSGAGPLINAIKQALDQVKAKNMNLDDFKILTTKVDEGPKLKRRRILHQGRSTMILKRMSHVTVILTDNGNQKSKVKMQNEKENIAKSGKVKNIESIKGSK